MTIETKTYQAESFLRDIKKSLESLIQTTASFACWKLPHSQQIIYCAAETYQNVENDLEKIGQGFILSPFKTDNNNNQAFLIPADIYGNSEIGFINYKEINPKKLKLDYIVEEPSKQNNHYVSIV
ncbi:MAG: hypothetical protein SNJ77_12935, partial [Cytophagales bacterium]